MHIKKTFIGLSIGFLGTIAGAQNSATIPSNPESGSYAKGHDGSVLRSQFGLCWRTGSWTAADAMIGCDGQLAPPIAKPTAPPVSVTPEATAATPAASTTTQIKSPPKRCDFTATLANKQTFMYNSAVLSDAAKQYIKQLALGKLASCEKIDAILITGHTDRLGSARYNLKLSDKRAKAVASYLQSLDITAAITTTGAGATQPVSSCSKQSSQAKFRACLGPDRRVVIDVRGIAK